MYLLYLLSLFTKNYTVVCDQIANKLFVLLNASISGKYCEKPSWRSASHARRQDSVTGGHEQILEEAQNILRIRERGPKTKFFITKFHEIWVDQKKVFISKYARIFTNSGVKTKKSSSSQNMRELLRIPG